MRIHFKNYIPYSHMGNIPLYGNVESLEIMRLSNYISSKRVGIFPLHESWIDIGNPDDFTKAKNYI